MPFYVLVPEKHKKGNIHLHVATHGFVDEKRLKRYWYLCVGGAGMGNVTISYKQHLTQLQRATGVAGYISKYISKQIGYAEFNKKRYWASRHKLPKSEKIILKAKSLVEAMKEACDMLSLDFSKVMHKAFRYNQILDGVNRECFWLSYDETLSAPVPF